MQDNFFEFAEKHGVQYKNRALSNFTINTELGKVLVVQINSAWSSSKNEVAGQLLMPNIEKEFENINDYKLVIALVHHPFHWLIPETRNNLILTIRDKIDLLFIGHEHRNDKFSVTGDDWSFIQYNGKELQNSTDPNDSSFSIFLMKEKTKIKQIEYSWNVDEKFYDRISEICNDIDSNRKSSAGRLYPNELTVTKLNDIGATIHHFRVDSVTLNDLFCWPELDMLDTQDDLFTCKTRIVNNIPEFISQYRIPLIVGSPSGGKTALMKSLFNYYCNHGICCISCKGNELVSPTEEGTLRIIESLFCTQYSSNSLEKFRQMDIQNKVLLIDDFETMTLNQERQSRILNVLLRSFYRIILFSGSDVNLSFLLAIRFTGSDEKVVPLRIRNMGNQKRLELIHKWYLLGNQYALEEPETVLKVERAREIIDGIIGSSQAIVPATPIVIISILQNIDAVGTNPFSGSQYGYLYENLVNRSLLSIPNTNPGTLNLQVAILSKIAYRMLLDRHKTFTKENLIKLVNDYNLEKLVSVDATDLLNKMLSARLLKDDAIGGYKFSYPYIFYYFCGKYIASHFGNDAVKKQVAHMSERLYIEDYGNIIIFVCHFSNNVEMIENVLLNSYTLFDKVQPFNFRNPNDVLKLANEAVERYLTPRHVGQETDVRNRRQEKLQKLDEAGVRDGSIIIDDKDNIENELEQEKNLAELISAIKTMDVLGQILRNYPGDIDRQNKLDIIDEVHSIGMRIVTMFFDAFGFLEEDLIKLFADNIKSTKRNALDGEVILYVKQFFSLLLSGVTLAMIRRIGYSLSSEHLLPACNDALNPEGSISGKLVIMVIQFSYLRKPLITEAINYYKYLRKNKLDFAAAILRSLVANYLLYNECGYDTRDRLCSEFGLEKTMLITEQKRICSS